MILIFFVVVKGRVKNVKERGKRTKFTSGRHTYILEFDETIAKNDIKRIKGKYVIILDKKPKSTSRPIIISSIEMMMKEKDYKKMCEKKQNKKSKKAKAKHLRKNHKGKTSNNREKSGKRSKKHV